jgi:GxxExxY protein
MSGDMTENDVARIIVDTAYHIHRSLGPGLLESVYERVLAHELIKRGLRVVRQREIPLVYGDLVIKRAYRSDLDVEELVIVEVKSIARLTASNSAQLLTQLRLLPRRLGLLINFGSALFKNGVKRVVNGLPDDQ